MNVTIRKYKPKDRKALITLMGELQDYIGQIDPRKFYRRLSDFDLKGYAEYNLKKIRTQQGAIYLAEDQGKIVGYVTGVLIAPSLVDELEIRASRNGEIIDLYVKADYRGKRIGSLLMKTMEAYFRKKRCEGIYLLVFAKNFSAYDFYKKEGYDERVINLYKPIKSA